MWSPTSGSSSPTSPTSNSAPRQSTRTKYPGRRIAQIIKLKPECAEKYKECHAKVWPEVLKQIKECNIEDCMSALYSFSQLLSTHPHTFPVSLTWLMLLLSEPTSDMVMA